MPETLETDSLLGTIVGALSRVHGDATAAIATLDDAAVRYEFSPVLQALSIIVDIAGAALRLLEGDIAA